MAHRLFYPSRPTISCHAAPLLRSAPAAGYRNHRRHFPLFFSLAPTSNFQVVVSFTWGWLPNTQIHNTGALILSLFFGVKEGADPAFFVPSGAPPSSEMWLRFHEPMVEQTRLELAWPAECLFYTNTAAGILLQLDHCSVLWAAVDPRRAAFSPMLPRYKEGESHLPASGSAGWRAEQESNLLPSAVLTDAHPHAPPAHVCRRQIRVIANQCAHWCGNPPDLRTAIIPT